MAASPPGQPDNGFEAFWNAYPKKEGRAQALAQYKMAVAAGALPSVLAAKAQQYATAKERLRDPLYLKWPSNWLREKCWLENPQPPKPKQAREPRSKTAHGKKKKAATGTRPARKRRRSAPKVEIHPGPPVAHVQQRQPIEPEKPQVDAQLSANRLTAIAEALAACGPDGERHNWASVYNNMPNEHRALFSDGEHLKREIGDAFKNTGAVLVESGVLKYRHIERLGHDDFRLNPPTPGSLWWDHNRGDAPKQQRPQGASVLASPSPRGQPSLSPVAAPQAPTAAQVDKFVAERHETLVSGEMTAAERRAQSEVSPFARAVKELEASEAAGRAASMTVAAAKQSASPVLASPSPHAASQAPAAAQVDKLAAAPVIEPYRPAPKRPNLEEIIALLERLDEERRAIIEDKRDIFAKKREAPKGSNVEENIIACLDRLEVERRAFIEDQRDIFAEAKREGLGVMVRATLRLRARKRREEQRAMKLAAKERPMKLAA